MDILMPEYYSTKEAGVKYHSVRQHCFGPLYAPAPLLHPETLIPDIELIIKDMNSTDQDVIRWKNKFCTVQERSNNINARCFHLNLKKSRQWLLQNNVIFTRADKSKEVVLLKRSNYNEKLKEYITNTECQSTPVNFLDTLQHRVKRFTSTALARRLHMQNSTILAPRTPRLFAFAKMHKPGNQLRLVIDKCGSPTFLIEKQLVNFFRARDHLHPFSISNSLQLVESLRDTSLTDKECMTVFDYKSLYPSIKLPPCFCSVRDFLFANIENAPSYHAHILELAYLICYTLFFEFEGNIFLQGRGVPMGSPTSSILCKLVLRQLENTILPEFQQQIILYARYIDDIFVLWHEEPNLQYFLNKINNNPYGLTLQLDRRATPVLTSWTFPLHASKGRSGPIFTVNPAFNPLSSHANQSIPSISNWRFSDHGLNVLTHIVQVFATR
ncbi:uncharacterized protein LOC111637234 [Centruroides sculpturatus]|uniref:uncharacterized protein LOC111637234 n=1 Tax=Centruroides sculpturatus TaxID=218467 RepID=UPI000C6E7C70|nr:uncharacterized protein LOC111637234 [Centruroides sculpturatus]